MAWFMLWFRLGDQSRSVNQLETVHGEMKGPKDRRSEEAYRGQPVELKSRGAPAALAEAGDLGGMPWASDLHRLGLASECW